MGALRKQFSPPHETRTFVELVRHQGGAALHCIRTYDDHERPCWFVLKASALSVAKLAHTSYDAWVDLTQFGEVIACGWGHEPAQA